MRRLAAVLADQREVKTPTLLPGVRGVKQVATGYRGRSRRGDSAA